MKYLIFFLFISFCISCGSNSLIESERKTLLKSPDPDKVSAKNLNELPEVYLFEESALQDKDEDLGLLGNSYYTGTDDVRISASFSFSQDYEDLTKVQSFDFQYLSHIDDSYREFWWGLQLKRTVAKYNAIAEESTTETLAAVRGSNTQSFTTIGLGLGHRFRALAGELLSERFFENVMVYGSYNYHQDGTNGKQYQGWGYSAEYGLNYRSSQKFFYGTKLSYNWALVEREEVGDEKLSERSLVFGWFTVGFELGFYF